MEEYLWSKKAFITNIHLEWLLSDGVDTFILLNPFPEIIVIFAEFLYYVWTNVGEFFLLRGKTHISTKHSTA